MYSTYLKQRSLVLNRNWQPVQVTSARRAILLVSKGAARVVDPTSFQLFDWGQWVAIADPEGAVLRTPRCVVQVPEVVALANYDRLPAVKVAFSKRNVFRRDHFTCQYCGHQPGTDELSIDHIKPRSLGGVSSWENCVLACVECNHRKADSTLAQSGMRLRRRPVRPSWRAVDSSMAARRTSWTPFLRGQSA